MTYQSLIKDSRSMYVKNPIVIDGKVSFCSGAEWMSKYMKYWIDDLDFDRSVNYNFYGLLKYSVSLLAFGVAFKALFSIHVLCVPFSVFVFYFVEVHFVFLFPLLIDKVENPIRRSIVETYKSGILRAIFIVFRIGVYMLMGLLNVKNPHRNWYIGCLAILIWYRNEVRARV